MKSHIYLVSIFAVLLFVFSCENDSSKFIDNQPILEKKFTSNYFADDTDDLLLGTYKGFRLKKNILNHHFIVIYKTGIVIFCIIKILLVDILP